MTLLAQLQAANLPVISADELGTVTMDTLTEEQLITFSHILLQYYKPTEYTLMQTEIAYRNTLKEGYAQALTVLQDIQNWTSPTNAVVIAGIKNMATIQEKLLKFLSKELK